jgi:hypothetical protein
VTDNRYTGPLASSAATTARRLVSEHAFTCWPVGVILEPHAFCGQMRTDHSAGQ